MNGRHYLHYVTSSPLFGPQSLISEVARSCSKSQTCDSEIAD